MTAIDISNTYNLTKGTIMYRAKKIGIKVKPKTKKIFTEEDVEKIINYQYCPRPINIKSYQKNKIDIIELYLLIDNNTSAYIASLLSLKKHYVSKVITEYLTNQNTITVISNL